MHGITHVNTVAANFVLAYYSNVSKENSITREYGLPKNPIIIIKIDHNIFLPYLTSPYQLQNYNKYKRKTLRC